MLTTLLLLFNFGNSATPYDKISIIIKDDGSISYTPNVLSSTANVEGYFIDSMENIGWGQLQIQINQDKSTTITDANRLYAAGFAEGILTAKQIYENYNNLKVTDWWDFSNGPSNDLLSWMNKQETWEKNMILNNPNNNMWQYIHGLNEQINGLMDGFNEYTKLFPNEKIPYQNNSWIFKFLNIMPDILDLQNVFNVSSRIDINKMNKDELWDYIYKRGHCSAVIKVTPELDDILFGHTTWMVYQMMNRIYKHYIFNLKNTDVKNTYIMFSSYPGVILSSDDYYISDKLVILQTTNSIINQTLYNLLTPNTLWYYERMRLANTFSTNGNEWFNNFKQYNSGTYNNQYMIITKNLFEIGKPLKDGLLTIIEQIPGLVLSQDMTNVLERGYFGSYNIPAIEKIYTESGYPELVKVGGTQYSYDLAPRARIFRRDTNKNVTDINSIQQFLRFNNYKNDPIENNDPTWAVAARGDLLNKNPSPFGGYDTKVGNYSMMINMQTSAINGPTQSNGLPMFNWKDWPNYPHYGIPDKMNFKFQFMQKLF